MTSADITTKIWGMLIFICFSLTGQTVSPSWKWQNPLPQGNQLRQVFFLDSLNGFAADIEAGTILKTTDGGGTWNIKWTYPGETPGYYGLSGIYFPNPDTGYAVGYWKGNKLTNQATGIILRSTDRGNTWQIISKGVYPSLLGVCFPNNGTIGYCVGFNGTILKTTNAGMDWISQNSGTNSILGFVDFPVDDQTGFVATGTAGPFVILKTTNGGLSWSTVNSGQGYFWGIKFVNNDIGYAAGILVINGQGGGHVIKTTNGGSTWQSVFFKNAGTVYGIDFTDSLTGHIAAYWGTIGWGDSTGILKTTDGGATWNMKLKVSLIRTNFFRWICFPTAKIGFATGAFDDQNGKHGQILKTADFGETWQYLTSYDVDTICDVDFPLGQETLGYAATTGGKVLKTTDGGNLWVDLNTGVSYPLHAVYFSDLNTGYACGNAGVVIKTIDGGTSWSSLNTNSTAELYDIYFPTSQIGYTGGYQRSTLLAEFLKTTDGGNTWIQQEVPNNQRFKTVRRIQFPISPDTGFFIVGPPRDMWSYTTGTLCKTTNGGLSWQQIYAPSNSIFFDLHFFNNQVGFIGGLISGGGNVYKVAKTTDGGNSWTLQFYSTDIAPVSCISFPSQQVGYAGYVSGGDHCLAKTTDGGATWFPINALTQHIYEELCFVNESIGFAVGRGGMIRKTTNGGQVWIAEDRGDADRKVDNHQGLWVYPNPFRNHLFIKSEIRNPKSAIPLRIYDVSGRVVKSFNLGSCIMNQASSIIWSGDDNAGYELPAGVYFIVSDDKRFSPVRVVKIK